MPYSIEITGNKMVITPVDRAWAKLLIGGGTAVWGLCFALAMAQAMSHDDPSMRWPVWILLIVAVQMSIIFGTASYISWYFISARKSVFVISDDHFVLNGRTYPRRDPLFIYIGKGLRPVHFWVGISYNTRRFPFARSKKLCVMTRPEKTIRVIKE